MPLSDMQKYYKGNLSRIVDLIVAQADNLPERVLALNRVIGEAAVSLSVPGIAIDGNHPILDAAQLDVVADANHRVQVAEAELQRQQAENVLIRGNLDAANAELRAVREQLNFAQQQQAENDRNRAVLDAANADLQAEQLQQLVANDLMRAELNAQLQQQQIENNRLNEDVAMMQAVQRQFQLAQNEIVNLRQQLHQRRV